MYKRAAPLSFVALFLAIAVAVLVVGAKPSSAEAEASEPARQTYEGLRARAVSYYVALQDRRYELAYSRFSGAMRQDVDKKAFVEDQELLFGEDALVFQGLSDVRIPEGKPGVGHVEALLQLPKRDGVAMTATHRTVWVWESATEGHPPNWYISRLGPLTERPGKRTSDNVATAVRVTRTSAAKAPR